MTKESPKAEEVKPKLVNMFKKNRDFQEQQEKLKVTEPAEEELVEEEVEMLDEAKQKEEAPVDLESYRPLQLKTDGASAFPEEKHRLAWMARPLPKSNLNAKRQVGRLSGLEADSLKKLLFG